MAKGKAPAFQFYPTDWIRDTRVLSLPARGAWADILAFMWDAPERGRLTYSWEGWARLLGCHADVTLAKSVIEELIAYKICDHVTECHGDVTLINRRMYREQLYRDGARLRKQRQRSHATTSRPGHGLVTPYSLSSSSSVSSSSLRSEEDTCAEPSRDSAPAVLTIPLTKNEIHPVTESDLNDLRQDFPAVDVLQELHKARAWCVAEPKRRKTKRGIRRFIVTWLSKCQDRGGSPGPRSGTIIPIGETWEERERQKGEETIQRVLALAEKEKA